MKIIDTRSGSEVQLGQTIYYPGDHWWKLLGIREGLLSAEVFVERGAARSRLIQKAWVPLNVRWLHPDFLFEKTGFFPS